MEQLPTWAVQPLFSQSIADRQRGETTLLLTILDDAWMCALGRRGDSHEQSEARTWFASDDVYVTSFVGICDVFEMDPVTIRHQLDRQRTVRDYRRTSFHGQISRRSTMAIGT